MLTDVFCHNCTDARRHRKASQAAALQSTRREDAADVCTSPVGHRGGSYGTCAEGCSERAFPKLVARKRCAAHCASRLTAMASGPSVSWGPRSAWVALHCGKSKWVGREEDQKEDEWSHKWIGEGEGRSSERGEGFG
jgi:hypothetical protein